jgi:hypothetical protein
MNKKNTDFVNNFLLHFFLSYYIHRQFCEYNVENLFHLIDIHGKYIWEMRN